MIASINRFNNNGCGLRPKISTLQNWIFRKSVMYRAASVRLCQRQQRLSLLMQSIIYVTRFQSYRNICGFIHTVRWAGNRNRDRYKQMIILIKIYTTNDPKNKLFAINICQDDMHANRQRTVHFWSLQLRPLSLMYKWLMQHIFHANCFIASQMAWKL